MKKGSLGFTLIEVMVAMFIMSTLAVMVSRTIRASVNNKQKIETKIKYQTALYDSLRIIKLDIERAFHYQDVFFEIEELAIKQLEAEKNKGKNQEEQEPTEARQPPPKLTHFLGETRSIHFTSLNHFRTKYNAQESDQMEVGYYVDSCKTRDGKGNTKCLWRRNSLIIDDEVDKGGKKVVVAEHVTSFKLWYRGYIKNKDKIDWLKQWRSDRKGRNEHRNKFPDQVKVELEIHDTDNKKANAFKQTMVVNIQFPNNEPLIAPSAPTKAKN